MERMVNKIAKNYFHWLSYFSWSHKAGGIGCNLCFPVIWGQRRSSSLIKLEKGCSECTCSSINTSDVVESKAVGTWIIRCSQKSTISFFFSSCRINLGKTKKHRECQKIQLLSNTLIFTGAVTGSTLQGYLKKPSILEMLCSLNLGEGQKGLISAALLRKTLLRHLGSGGKIPGCAKKNTSK